MGQITWIKDGKIKTMGQLRHAILGKEEAYEYSSVFQSLYEVPKNIELLHLKNCRFIEQTTFHCKNPKTILILENCKFDDSTKFRNGDIRLENPNISSSCWHLTFENNDTVEIALPSELGRVSSTNYRLKNVNTLYVTGCLMGSKFESTGVFPMELVRFQKVERACLDYLKTEAIEAIDSKLEMKREISCKSIDLDNSVITSFYKICCQEKLNVKNSKLNCPILDTGTVCYHLKDGLVEFSSSEEETNGNLSAVRARLFSAMKAISTNADSICQEQIKDKKDQLTEKYLPEIQKHKESIDYYEALIAAEQNALGEIEARVDSTSHQLVKQKIKNLKK